MIGGYDDDRGSSSSEVWYTENGTSWSLATNEPGFSARAGHTLTVYKDKMWVIGGENSDDAVKTQPDAEKASLITGIWYLVQYRWHTMGRVTI